VAKRPDITTIASGYYSRISLNTNFENLQAGFDNTLSLDGSSPNAMQADFDLNSNDLLNGNRLYTTELYINGVKVIPGSVVDSGALLAVNDLSDVASVPTSRQNLNVDVSVTDLASPRTVVASDINSLIRCSAAMTLPLTAAATLTTDFVVTVKADGGDVTIDPDGSETIDGSATLVISDGTSATIFCTGTTFYSVSGGGSGGGAAISRTVDTLVSNGTQPTMTLTVTPAGVEYVKVSYDGVTQEPTTDYTVSGTTLTFVGVPASGVRVLAVTDSTEAVGVPSDGTITTAKLATGAVTSAKIASGVIPGLFKGNNGEVGSAPGDIFRINAQTLTTSTTIDADENASCTGPFAVSASATLTINGNLTVV